MDMQLDLASIVIRDVNVGFTFLTASVLVVISYGFYKKRPGRVSGAGGLSAYFATFAVYTFMTNMDYLYAPYVQASYLSAVGTFVWIGGILYLVYSMESDLAFVGIGKYYVFLISVAYTIVSLVPMFTGGPTWLVFVGLSIAIVYVTYTYIERVMELETARKTFPELYFGVGFAMSGFANFMLVLWGVPEVFMAKNALVLAGSLMISYSWRGIPSAEDLSWLLSLDRLLVMGSEASLPIVDFRFRRFDDKSGTEDTDSKDGMLVAGAISGINTLIGEILADSGGLDEIEYGKRTILFHRRKHFVSMLVAQRSIPELRYRLEAFSLAF
ncbi:MAG: hypothetical protein HXY34_06565 [Candidatus Thorarchaeota archaeon]|nr:hypothetical protein [Candidatus Thorarchaeota archaeon]